MLTCMTPARAVTDVAAQVLREMLVLLEVGDLLGVAGGADLVDFLGGDRKGQKESEEAEEEEPETAC